MDNTKTQTKKKLFKYVLKFAAFFLLGTGIAAGFLFYKVNNTVDRIFAPAAKGGSNSSVLKDLESVEKEGDGRVNFLILGFDAYTDSTDTIILASMNPETGHTAMFSLPRDLFVPAGRLKKSAKINAIFKEAEAANPGSGGDIMKQAVGELLDVNIHYYVTFNWDGFKQFIDTIGGVDVDVPYTLSDGKIYIKKGRQHLNGQLALDFVRCRKGSCKKDFGRQDRQQALIKAIHTKIKEDKSYQDPKAVFRMMEVLGGNMRTDVRKDQIKGFIELSGRVDNGNIETRVLDYGYGKPLKTSWEKGYGYVLKPVTGNFDEIRRIVHELLDDPHMTREAASIEIQDGGSDPAAFEELVKKLTSYGYNITGKRKAGEYYKESVIVDYANGAKQYTRKYLELRFRTQAKVEQRLEGQQVDILIIIGDNYYS